MNNPIGPVSGRSAVVGDSSHSSQIARPERAFFDSGASAHPPSASAGHPFPIEELGLRHLKTFPEIEKILHLREAIDLSVHSHAHSNFVALEKKETSAASSGRSNCAGKS